MTAGCCCGDDAVTVAVTAVDAVTLNPGIKSQTTRSEKKTMSEELEELWEEVVEEILDTVNPEDD